MPVPKIIADFDTQLSTALAIGGTSFSIATANDDDGVALPAGLYYFTIDNGTSAKEYVSGTLSGTSVTGVKTVSRQGTETSGVVRAHRVGASVILTDFATYKSYIDQASIAGAVDASVSAKGIVQLATQAEVVAKTATGSTGAPLFVSPDKMSSVLTSDYKADTGSANTYAIAPSPAITAYTAGQVFTFKATNANTTASTLNVNSLGTKSIKKVDGATDLVANDIKAGQIVRVVYDGTNFQMISPVGNSPIRFGGTGADGALSITSGTTTIDCANAAVVVKNYTSVSITGTGVLGFSNPHANGTIVILKSQGNVTLTSSASPMINLSAMGAAGGTGNTGNGVIGSVGYGSDGVSIPTGALLTAHTQGAAGGASIFNNGAGAVPSVAPRLSYFFSVYGKFVQLATGAGGGPGSATGGSGTAGNGGRGGGGLYIECAGAWNFTTSGGISVAGQAGANGGSSSTGGGGGGGAGLFVAVYVSLTANSGTVTVSGGAGGTGTGTGGSGNTGGAGASLIAANTEFA